MNDLNFEITKVDTAMAALAKLPEGERSKIMDGLREIVKMYANKNLAKPSLVKFRWWEWGNEV
ncbi:MAG: hypothetical protein JNM78_17120 [Cyclobacteriaceae bacterium]|nr:hypothetical protein [Cyclobacteriaceae bacterium]